MADESAAPARAAPDAEGEQRAAWTADEWRAYAAAIRAAADDADYSFLLVGLVNAVTCSLAAGWPCDDADACEAAAACIVAVIDALYARPPDAALRAAVASALHAVTTSWPQSLRLTLEFRQAVSGALVSMLDQFLLDEPVQTVSLCSALHRCFTARAEGAVDGEPSQRLMSSGLATAAAAALARTCVRFVSVPYASNVSAAVLSLVLNRTDDDQAPVRRAVLDAAPSLPRVLLSALTSFGETHNDDGADLVYVKGLLLQLLGKDAEVAALLRAEPGAASGEGATVRAVVRALGASATVFPERLLAALVTAESLVKIFTCTEEELAALPTRVHRAYVRSGLVEFEIEQLVSRGCADAQVFARVLIILQAIVRDESESIAREAVTQPAVNAVFAALRAHAATMDAALANLLCVYLSNAAIRFGRRPSGADMTPAALASTFAPLLRVHLSDRVSCLLIVSVMQTVSKIHGITSYGSAALMRSCAPVLLDALRRHAAVPDVAACIGMMLSDVVKQGFDMDSPYVPSELGDLRALVVMLAAAVRAAVDAVPPPPACDDGRAARDVLLLTITVGKLAAAVVPFQNEVARDPAMLGALVAALRLQPFSHVLLQNVAASLRAVLRIDESGSHAQKRAMVALLRSSRLGIAFCAAAEATGHAMPHGELVSALVAFFTRHGLHVDIGTTTRAARTCGACGAVETGQQLAALSPGSAKHRLCSRCLRVSYCSVACQHAAWPAHKATCRAASEE